MTSSVQAPPSSAQLCSPYCPKRSVSFFSQRGSRPRTPVPHWEKTKYGAPVHRARLLGQPQSPLLFLAATTCCCCCYCCRGKSFQWRAPTVSHSERHCPHTSGPRCCASFHSQAIVAIVTDSYCHYYHHHCCCCYY